MRFSLFAKLSQAVQSFQEPRSFGAARAQKMEARLNRAVRERRELARATAGASEPIRTTLSHRGDHLSRQIGRLQAEQKSK